MTDVRPELSIAHVVGALHTLGVKRGGVLVVHSSYRAARPIEAGPLGLIEAIEDALGQDGTLAMPSWTGDDDSVFDAAITPPAADLGVLPHLFWRLPNVRRSSHPFAFAARGPMARAITSAPLVFPPHAPESAVGEVLGSDGQILLLGVGHDANTMLHLAELLADVPYRIPKHATVEDGGAVKRVDYAENDHCCQRFSLADEWLRGRGLQREGPVGHASARLMRARDIVDVTCAELRLNPFVFLHPRASGCEECDAAWASVRSRQV